MRAYWFIILVCGLLFTGCGEKETITSTESTPTPAPATKPAVVEQVKQSTDDVAKQATEIVETVTQMVKETPGEAKQAVEKVVATATENVTAAAAVAKQEVVEVKELLKQEGTQLLNGLENSPATSKTSGNGLLPSVAAVVSSVTAPTKVAPEVQPAETPVKSGDVLSGAATIGNSVMTPSEVTTEVQASETLVIENKKGNVTLSHAEHGKLYGCASCHGDAVPGAFELGKDTAHAMCKGCHKEQGGPTKCSGCHKK